MDTSTSQAEEIAHDWSRADLDPIEPLWSIEQVAIFTAVPVSTLFSLRTARRGPPGARVGRSLRFKPEAVRSWFDDLTAASEARP